MKFDSYGCIVMEEPDPGCLGDSCAETSRFFIMSHAARQPIVNGELIFEDATDEYDRMLSQTLEQFVSTHGFLRHPDAPYGPPRSLDSWRESDASADQVLPLLICAKLNNLPVAETIAARLRSTWTVAPGHMCPPALMALAYGKLTLFKWLTRMQTGIFKIPFRWSDSKKWFEKSAGSSADWLNYAASIVYLRLNGIDIPYDKAKLLASVRAYYEPQANSQWVVAAYEKAFS